MIPSFLKLETIQGLQSGPLYPYAKVHLAWLQAQNYKTRTAHEHLRLFARLNGWIVRKGLRLRELNENTLRDFLQRRRCPRKSWSGAGFAFRHLLSLLREAGATPRAKMVRPTPAQHLVNDYRRYLLEERGCTTKTTADYSRHADRFLLQRFNTGHVKPSLIRAGDVIWFVQRNTLSHSQVHSKQVVTSLRSFLGYLHYTGRIPRDLTAIVPKVPHWRLTGLPKHLPAEAVQQVLDRCDQGTAIGKRNYAILLLLARLGLRAGEVISLRLEDIDWQNAQLLIRSRKGPGLARLPLPADVGKALARYLKEGRPPCTCRQVFIRSEAPYTALSNSAVLSVLVGRAIDKAGVASPRRGAHVFRHSLATAMLGRGASLTEIGQVLRHHDPDSTGIYAKVDLKALRPLALPWPGGAR